MINIREQFWAVELPKEAINIIIDMGYIIWKAPNYKNWCTNDILSDYNKLSKYLETHKAEDDYKTGGMLLPPGTWQIVCTSKEVTVKDAAQIVQKFNNGVYRDYKLSYFDPCDELMDCFLCPIESLHSLLTSKGCDLNKTYLILKKIA